PPPPAPATVVASVQPVPGERWIYRVHGLWATNRERVYEFAVESASGQVVTEALRERAAGNERSLQTVNWNGAQAEIVHRRGDAPEFSPYLPAFGALDVGHRWRSIPTPAFDGIWGEWFSTGKVDGLETIAVPAGRFEAWRVEIRSSRQATGGPATADIEPVRVDYDIWFAPTVKRYVKQVRTVKSARGRNIERDVFELEAMHGAGTR
ncbi:MAG TPA: hypothetical protein PK725_16265, partial [Rhodocyclaceae bacterium]|nr:hypothetical protein [Rhodocyclaceae bacterium]